VDEILAKVTPASTTFPLPDALGSTIAVTDASGAVLERVYYFDAFGTPTFRSGTGAPLPDTSTGTRFLFTGREWFARLGLYDYRNRVYSAELGRFLQTDPIRFSAGDVNLYRYVGNDPQGYRDPFGLDRRVVIAGHVWIIVDVYDECGSKIGERSLHFGPDFHSNDPSEDILPDWLSFNIPSTPEEDQALLDLWKDMEQEQPIPYTGYPYNCISVTCAAMNWGK
jgi:RHS repeat-associated protein